MEIYIFAKFHVLEGKQGEATEALKEVLGPTRRARLHLYSRVPFDPRRAIVLHSLEVEG